MLDADIRSCLESSSHCRSAHGGRVEEGGFGVWDQYSQAFSASGADVDGLQLAALDTLQYGLAGDAEREGGLEHGEPAVGGVCRRTGARSSLVRRMRQGAPGVICSPAMNPSLSQRCRVDGASPRSPAARATVSSSPSGGVGRSAGGRGCSSERRRLDTIWAVNRQSAGGAAALPVEDPGDRRVGVVDGEAAHQVDGVLVGADRGLVACAAGRPAR